MPRRPHGSGSRGPPRRQRARVSDRGSPTFGVSGVRCRVPRGRSGRRPADGPRRRQRSPLIGSLPRLLESRARLLRARRRLWRQGRHGVPAREARPGRTGEVQAPVPDAACQLDPAPRFDGVVAHGPEDVVHESGVRLVARYATSPAFAARSRDRRMDGTSTPSADARRRGSMRDPATAAASSTVAAAVSNRAKRSSTSWRSVGLWRPDVASRAREEGCRRSQPSPVQQGCRFPTRRACLAATPSSRPARFNTSVPGGAPTRRRAARPTRHPFAPFRPRAEASGPGAWRDAGAPRVWPAKPEWRSSRIKRIGPVLVKRPSSSMTALCMCAWAHPG